MSDKFNNISWRIFISMFPCKVIRCLLTCEYCNREQIMLVTPTLYLRLNVFTCGMSTRDRAPALACCDLLQEEWIMVTLKARNFRIFFLGVALRSWVDSSRRFEGTYLLHSQQLPSWGWRLTLKLIVLLPDAIGSTLNMLASLGPHRWQHIFVWSLNEHCIAAEDTGSRKTILLPRIQLCPYHSIRTLYKVVFDQNWICYDSKSQG
jgi:hypothetical protein